MLLQLMFIEDRPLMTSATDGGIDETGKQAKNGLASLHFE